VSFNDIFSFETLFLATNASGVTQNLLNNHQMSRCLTSINHHQYYHSWNCPTTFTPHFPVI
jgi:hypothetical protein